MRLYKYKARVSMPETENQVDYKVKGLIQTEETDKEVIMIKVLKWLADKENVSEYRISDLKVKKVPII